jgi:hypothetical protein
MSSEGRLERLGLGHLQDRPEELHKTLKQRLAERAKAEQADEEERRKKREQKKRQGSR